MEGESQILIPSLKETKETGLKQLSPVLSLFIFMENQDVTCKKCGSINNYKIELRGIHHTAYCNVCESYIKNLPQGKPITLFFGKYKERTIDSMLSKDEIQYLQWLSTKPDLKPNSLRDYILKHLEGK